MTWVEINQIYCSVWNMKKKIIGTTFQVIAVCLLMADIFIMYPTIVVLLGGLPNSAIKADYDPVTSFFPFALWFLGSAIKNHSPMAVSVTILGMLYLASIAILSLIKTLKLTNVHEMPSEMVLPLYGVITLALIVPAVCIWAVFPIQKAEQSGVANPPPPSGDC